jgi:hypothetical protein
VPLPLRHAFAALVMSASVRVATSVHRERRHRRRAANVAALQTLAVNWASGAGGTSYHPGGAYYQGLLAGGVIQTLSGD